MLAVEKYNEAHLDNKYYERLKSKCNYMLNGYVYNTDKNVTIAYLCAILGNETELNKIIKNGESIGSTSSIDNSVDAYLWVLSVEDGKAGGGNGSNENYQDGQTEASINNPPEYGPADTGMSGKSRKTSKKKQCKEAKLTKIRNRQIIYGKGKPGTKVHVKLGKKTYIKKIGKSGKFHIKVGRKITARDYVYVWTTKKGYKASNKKVGI